MTYEPALIHLFVLQLQHFVEQMGLFLYFQASLPEPAHQEVLVFQ